MRLLTTIAFFATLSALSYSFAAEPQACYIGTSSGDLACFSVVAINPVNFGYKVVVPSNLNKTQYRSPVSAMNLVGVDPKKQISSNYLVNDVMRLKDGDIGIFSPLVIKNIQAIRDELKTSIRITSGYRTPKKNVAVGGATWSRHSFGDAVDVSVPGVAAAIVEKICKRYGAFYTDTYKDGHVHCDWRSTALDTVFFGVPNKSRIELPLSEEDHLRELYDSSEIRVEGDIREGSTVILSSEMQNQEDAGELVKKWVIFLPNGKRYEAKASEARLQLAKGAYQIIHYIGSNVVLNKSFVVQ